MRYPPRLLDEIRARLPVSHVVSRKVALKRAGRELKGLSPFKAERTPSFYVNDHKAFYHCFSSGEHGDIFKFVMTTEGLSFPEAVERLAAEAGVALPKQDERTSAQVRAREEHTDRLLRLLEAAAAFYRAELAQPAGREARAYLERRGLERATLQRFGIGYAPGSRNAVKSHLLAAGFTLAEIAESGMVVTGEEIAEPYDRFRNRIMFPIADLKGRTIAFGGRALDPDAPAKYLNSPETPLFHKGSVLFNAHRARATAFERKQIVAVEGYMDVIALDRAGFANAVAPLGTALTEGQLQLLWRSASEPVLCFDGDSAGRRAAYRAIDTALPHLQPGASLAFAFLPDGLDPDDLVRDRGAEALGSVLERTRPLIDVLWEREWDDGRWTTPERRAALEQRLAGLVAQIGEPSVRSHYQRALRERLFAAWRGQPGSGVARGAMQGKAAAAPGRGASSFGGRTPGRGGGATASRGERSGKGRPAFDAGTGRPTPSEHLLRSSLVAPGVGVPYREALLLKALLNHPWLLLENAEGIAALELGDSVLRRLRDDLLSLAVSIDDLDSAAIRHQLTRSGSTSALIAVDRAVTHRADKFAEPGCDRSEVEAGWRHAVGLHERHARLERERRAAETAWREDASEESLARILDLQAVREAVPVDHDG
jgi:DNA primase